MNAAAIVDRWPRLTVPYARASARLGGHPLPPGELVALDVLERGRRMLLMDLHGRHGTVFKGLTEDRLTVCVVGLDACRQLLREHGAALRPLTIDVQSLFPRGFLRQMQGSDHRHYRQALVRAIRPEDLMSARATHQAIVASGLAQGHEAGDPRAFVASTTRMATALLLRSVFGTEPESAAHSRLMAAFHDLGPHGLVWRVAARQRRAFAALCTELRDWLAAAQSAREPAFATSVLGRLAEAGAIDETMWGNLVYLVEMGRYDMAGLFRWLLVHAAEHPLLLDQIEREQRAPPVAAPPMHEAFVLETLRVNQSERLMRRAQRDIVFLGHLIPRWASVRLCLWESHRSPSFERPFDFDPTRFMHDPPGSDRFAPFGLDEHRCPFAAWSIDAGAVLMTALARTYRVQASGPPVAVRGAYHWEPTPALGLHLQPWTAARGSH